MYFCKFFVALRWTEAITWENFVPAKRDPGSTKVGSRFAGMKLFPCNHRKYKSGIPAQWDRISSRQNGIM